MTVHTDKHIHVYTSTKKILNTSLFITLTHTRTDYKTRLLPMIHADNATLTGPIMSSCLLTSVLSLCLFLSQSEVFVKKKKILPPHPSPKSVSASVAKKPAAGVFGGTASCLVEQPGGRYKRQKASTWRQRNCSEDQQQFCN